MFGISFEHILIVGVILLIVGPRRLPELGNTMGKAIKNFKDSISGIEEANFKRINEKENADTSAKPAPTASASNVDDLAVPPSSSNKSAEAKPAPDNSPNA